ncbi:MAG: SPFH domain-containing protein [Planctomycetaceae bacterium]
MSRMRPWLAIAALAYLATGFFVVRGDEQALVRRFGRAKMPLRQSGLYLDFPWPFTRVDRVNVNAVKTLSIGVRAVEPDALSYLPPVNLERQGEFLTGDKNVLQLAVNVQYRIADPLVYCTASEAPETGLALLVESLVADVVSRSGVDFVHPLGLNELKSILTREARVAAQVYPWGLSVDEVTIAGAFPPVEVKASFLDVSNARAEKDRVINQEQARAERRVSAASARANAALEQAHAQRHVRVQTARGSADRFTTVIASFQGPPGTGDAPEQVRRRTMQRLFAAAMEEILPRLRGKVLLDPAKPLDLTIFPADVPGK